MTKHKRKRKSNGVMKVGRTLVGFGILFSLVGLYGYSVPENTFLFGLWQDIFTLGVGFLVFGISALVLKRRL